MVDDPDATVQLENPVCGDILKLSAKVRDGRIAEIRFQAKGCVPAIACASAVTELVEAKSLPEARKVRRDDIVNQVGGVPPASTHAAQLAADALKTLAKKLAASGHLKAGK